MANIIDLHKISPWLDLKKTFRGREKVTAIVLGINLILSGFLAGLVYQYYQYFCGRRRKVAILNAVIIGIKECPLATLILFVLLFYPFFRFLRMLNLNKKNYENGVERSENSTFGHAHFQDETEREKNFKMCNGFEETVDEVLGIDGNNKYCSLIVPPGKNRNRIFFGSPGSGKSSAIVVPDTFQCIRRGQSCIAADSKGTVYGETAAIARQNNFVVKVLNLKSKELQNSNAFNVMAYLDSTSSSFTAECQSIAEIIISMTQAENPMEYWAEQSRQLLALVIMELASNEIYRTQKQNNLYGVYQFLSSKSADELKEIFTRYPQGTPIRNAYNNFSKADAKNQGQIINGLTGRLWMLNNPIFEHILGENEIDLTLPMKRPCVYYVIIPDDDTTYNFIGSLFFSMMFKKQIEYSDSLTRKEREKDQLEVNYLLDEYKNFGGVYRLDTMISVVRSRKINITIILQLLNQLYLVHGEDRAKEILNDCTVKGLLSTSDTDTAKYFSELLGTFTVVTEGERYEEAKTDVLHLHGVTNKTRGEQGVPLRRHESLMNDEMNRDDVIYVIDNMAPVILKKAFAEKNGEPIHFMEAQSMEIGELKSKNYRPHWRKVLEENETKIVNLKPTAPAWYKEKGNEEVIDFQSMYEADDPLEAASTTPVAEQQSKPKPQPIIKLTEVKEETESENKKTNDLLSIFGDD